MRYGLIADIHSNLEALEAVLEALKKEGVARYLCVGDIVGYGADPKECIRRVRGLDCLTVAGNHDHAAVGLTDIDYFNPYAKEAVLWTQGQLDDEEKGYLSNLNFIEKLDDFLLVHGTLHEPQKWHYLLSTYDAEVSFCILDSPLCFVGHSHVPITFFKGEHCQYTFDSKISLDEDKRYIINIGSVGQPRDGNPKASFCIYDTDERLVEIRRIGYDRGKAQEKILQAGLPEILAYRLSRGE